MDTQLIDFIRSKKIDSFQKVRFLLFLHQHPNLKENCQQLAQRLFVGLPLLERIIEELRAVGLIDCIKNCYALHREPELQLCLVTLSKTFEDPLARQEMLDYVRRRSTPSYL